MTNETIKALMKVALPKRRISTDELQQVQSFFDFCQTVVVASWVKADDATFDPRSFVGVPLEVVMQLSSDTKPGGQAVWDKHNMLNNAFNQEMITLQARIHDWREDHPYEPTSKTPSMKAADVLNDYHKFTISGRAYGTRTVGNEILDAPSPIYDAYLTHMEGNDYVPAQDQPPSSRNADIRKALVWNTFIPALVECGWFPEREHFSINGLAEEYVKALKRPAALNTFRRFETQARETAQIMLAEAKEYWMSR